jgi:hypothetical protein
MPDRPFEDMSANPGEKRELSAEHVDTIDIVVHVNRTFAEEVAPPEHRDHAVKVYGEMLYEQVQKALRG